MTGYVPTDVVLVTELVQLGVPAMIDLPSLNWKPVAEGAKYAVLVAP